MRLLHEVMPIRVHWCPFVVLSSPFRAFRVFRGSLPPVRGSITRPFVSFRVHSWFSFPLPLYFSCFSCFSWFLPVHLCPFVSIRGFILPRSWFHPVHSWLALRLLGEHLGDGALDPIPRFSILPPSCEIGLYYPLFTSSQTSLERVC